MMDSGPGAGDGADAIRDGVNHGPFGEKNFFIPNGHWPYGARLLTTGPARERGVCPAARSPGSSAAGRVSQCGG
jgi:hypothetical protein